MWQTLPKSAFLKMTWYPYFVSYAVICTCRTAEERRKFAIAIHLIEQAIYGYGLQNFSYTEKCDLPSNFEVSRVIGQFLTGLDARVLGIDSAAPYSMLRTVLTMPTTPETSWAVSGFFNISKSSGPVYRSLFGKGARDSTDCVVSDNILGDCLTVTSDEVISAWRAYGRMFGIRYGQQEEHPVVRRYASRRERLVRNFLLEQMGLPPKMKGPKIWALDSNGHRSHRIDEHAEDYEDAKMHGFRIGFDNISGKSPFPYYNASFMVGATAQARGYHTAIEEGTDDGALMFYSLGELAVPEADSYIVTGPFCYGTITAPSLQEDIRKLLEEFDESLSAVADSPVS